jgi:hypothetical protein
MANHGKELSSIDFGAMIGGPLDAVIEAQAKSALTTVDFIKQVGFDQDKKPIYVEFEYDKLVEKQKTDGSDELLFINSEGKEVTDSSTTTGTGNDAVTVQNTPAMEEAPQDMQLKVPILTLLPIPFIRVEEMTIDFNAKINSMSKNTNSSSFGIKGSLEVKQKWLGGSAKLNVSASYKKQRSSTSETKKTYSLAIHVKAVQDEMPAGMERILNILEENIQSTAKKSATTE